MITTINKLEQLNTQGIKIKKLLDQVVSINARREDIMLDMKDFKFNSNGTIGINGRDYDITEYALSQDCAKIKVPVTYIKNCFNTGIGELAADNMNTWTSVHGDKKVFIRAYDGIIRGVLSDRYSKLDSQEILEVLDSSDIPSKFKVVGSYLSADRFHLRMINPKMIDVDGEDLFTGIQIDNSDVGMASLSVTLLIYKQVCTNGLILPKDKGILFKKKHIGIDSTDFKEQMIDSLSKIKEYTDLSVYIINRTREVRFNVLELDKRLDRVKLDTNIGDDGIDFMRELIQHKYGANNWGLVNALTEVAQRYTLDRRLEIERYASKLLVA